MLRMRTVIGLCFTALLVSTFGAGCSEKPKPVEPIQPTPTIQDDQNAPSPSIQRGMRIRGSEEPTSTDGRPINY